jgi:transposase
MEKIREIIYFYQSGVTSIRRIASACRKSRTAVSHVLSRIAELKLTASNIESISDADLENIIYPVKQKQPENFTALEKNLPALLSQLNKKHNTIFNVWEDYRKENPDGYSYSRFCFNLRQLQDDDEKISMHLEHAPGDKLFVDFAGDKLDVMRTFTDEKWIVNVFVAVLPNSLYTYVEATENETTASWITATENAQIFFGGVPQAIVPDCAKAVVKKADRYESSINPQYDRFARHYKTVILPARPGHPQDKALVESAVRLVYQRIYARIAGQRFSSLQEINAAILPLLEEHNSRNMRAWNCSRRELFESREKALLKALPQNRFDYFEYEPYRSVAWNCHVYFKPDRHYYSVPVRFKSPEFFFEAHIIG